MVVTVRKQDLVAMPARDARRASETENMRTVRTSSNQYESSVPDGGIAGQSARRAVAIGRDSARVGDASKTEAAFIR
ncbi:hypothetical protein BRO09_17560 [Xanthomonas oryzae pv. oryzae]|nr:hypothetical protein BRO09_17560 [Xanthomonas oryzae pv. oryzae]RBB23182.1 hypothetical protein BRO04_18155 [Xanthomonas oryzae pv. oryzae]RBJ18113.1 hypothetical protein BRO08_15220 [Xanthomonas oryzae pv. oryzae]RBK11299.1 hypothetical protein BRN80_24990 [Xanthomonas oryzae pv. oryzae]